MGFICKAPFNTVQLMNGIEHCVKLLLIITGNAIFGEGKNNFILYLMFMLCVSIVASRRLQKI